MFDKDFDFKKKRHIFLLTLMVNKFHVPYVYNRSLSELYQDIIQKTKYIRR